MKKQNKNNNKSYESDLYIACKYLSENIEKFQSFIIYKEKDLETGQIMALNLHNRLLAQFYFLKGINKNKPSELNSKGSEIMPKINVESLGMETLAKMLVIIDNYVNGEDKDGKRMNQKMVDVKVDKESKLMNYLIEKLMPDKIDELDQFQKEVKGEEIKEKEYFKILDFIYENEKSMLLHNSCNINKKEKLWNRYYEKIDFYKKELIDKTDVCITNIFFNGTFPRYGELEEFYNTWMYIDLCCNAILQYVIQGIIKNTENSNKLASIQKINNKILELIEKEKDIPIIECKGSPEENLFNVYSYYFIRDKLLQDTKNIKIISTEDDKLKNLKVENSLKNFYTEKKERTWDEIQDLFEDGKKSNEKTFKQNLANCYLLIEKLNRNGRNIKNTPVFLRALYREVYLNTTMNGKKRRTSKTIMNNFLRTGYIDVSDYYWIDELLNRSFFKEQGLLEEFYAKNELQENLYYLICLLLARLNPIVIMKEFNPILHQINAIIDDIHNTYKKYSWTEEIPNNCMVSYITPSNEWKITNEKYKEIYRYLEVLLDISDLGVYYLEVSI